MPEYRRWRVPGGTYFFTAVAERRRPILTTELGRNCLRDAIERTRKDRPFDISAVVLLPDHLHAMWKLPPGDDDFPTRWSLVKRFFTEAWLEGGGTEVPISASRRAKGERGVWQRRYWEHLVRDDGKDPKRCLDYIHWNPRKHGYVGRVRDWPYSSFHRSAALGEYTENWGGEAPCGYDHPQFRNHD